MTEIVALEPNGVCRSCGRPVHWVTFVSGKRNPLDVHPDASGNVVLTGSSDPGGQVVARVLTRQEQVERQGVRYRSHFTSCPNASEHRR